MDANQLGGIIGGALGCIIGTIGGLIGTYASIRNTNGPKERSYMVRWAVYGWLGIVLFLALLFTLPDAYRPWLWAPYGLLLPLAIITCNRGLARIRAEEQAEKEAAEAPEP